MAELEMSLTFKDIIIRTRTSKYDEYLKAVAGSVKNDNIGEFVYAKSAMNLEKIFKVFDGKVMPKPEVVSGINFLNTMRDGYRAYKNAKSRLQDVMKLDRYPLEPNGKFFPYAHQTKIVGALLTDPFTPVAADCGTGKTGSTARAIELLINDKTVSKAKTLISAPLSILSASWLADIEKFTNLRPKLLWAPISNKTLKIGEKYVVAHGVPEKPEGAVTVQSKKGMKWLADDGRMKPAKEKLSLFDVAETNWEKIEVHWKQAIMLDGTEVPFGPIYGQKTVKEETRKNFIREALKDSSVDLFIINHDGVRIYEDVLKEHKFEWLVVDESTKIKSASSKVTKAHISISWDCQRRTILSGTPNPNGFMDLWSQFYFLDRGMTFSTKLQDFRHDYFRAISMGHFGGNDAVKWEIRDIETRNMLVDRVKHASIFLKQRDCVDLPPRTDMTREVYMTAQQSKAYKDMEKELVAELLDKKTQTNVVVEAKNILAKLMKLRQITSGFVGHEGEVLSIENNSENPKFEEMDALVEEIGDNKIVIACQFKEEIYSLLARYKHLGAAAIFGDAKVEDRTANIKKFQETDELRVMILQPQAAAHGITLTKAHYFAFLSLDYNFEYYYQTGKRIERIGQKNPMFVYHLLARTETGGQTIDHDLMEVLKGKSANRDLLFDDGVGVVEVASVLMDKLIKRSQEQ